MPRIVTVAKIGSPDVLQIHDIAAQAPGPGEVRLRVMAFAVNRGDLLYRAGTYFERPGSPGRIGYDCAGVIEAVGTNVRAWRIGDRVATFPAFAQNSHGVYGEVAIVPETALMDWPAGLSAGEAAALGTQYMTGCFALREIGGLQSHEPVLITAGGSGAGLAATQIAKALGSLVLTTTRSADKAPALRKAGADHVIVTSLTGLGEGVGALTDGLGVRLIVDCVGGPGFGSLADALRPDGTLVSYGFLGGSDLAFSALPFYRKGISIRFVQVFQMTGLPLRGTPQQREAVERSKALIASGVAGGTIRPAIGARFALEEVVAAHRLMETGEIMGKIIIDVAAPGPLEVAG
jgi:NADPH:quinone reductase-like Zn-dependent oxidoreductase